VTDSNYVVCTNLGNDGHVAGEIEMDRQLDEFVESHQIVRCDEGNVEDQNESFLIRFVNVRGFDENEVRRLVDKREHVAVLCNFIDVLHHCDKSFMVQGPQRKSV
jgi:hypothetical protein